jgi:hypothetical protein
MIPCTEVLTESGSVYYIDPDACRVYRSSTIPMEVESDFRTEDEKTGRWREFTAALMPILQDGSRCLMIFYPDGTASTSTRIVTVNELVEVDL